MPEPHTASSGSMTGLSPAEVAERRRRGEINTVARATSRTYGGIVRSNLLNVFNIAVFSMATILAVLYASTGDRRTLFDALAISGVAFTNTIIGIIQEIRAKIALDRISALASPTATVVRAGLEEEISTAEIVRGDVIRLRRGDQIPVDGRILSSAHCEVDESLLTGESIYVYKDEDDPVLSGSFCVAGGGLMVAEQVGAQAYVHRLSGEVKSYKRFATPLQRNIDQLVKILVATAGALSALVVGAALVRYYRGPDPLHGLALVVETTRSVASIVTAMVPVGLILLSTVAFALGVFRISRRGALVQKLNAVESFAHVDVLCMDKTGTLTMNELRVREVHSGGAHTREQAVSLLLAFAHGSSEENATILAIRREGESPGASVLDEIPFNSKEKFSALTLGDGERRERLFLGALERLEASLPTADVGQARAQIEGNPGQRHLVFARAPGAGPLRDVLAGTEVSLEFVAVVSLMDEVRPAIGDVLERFADQGIRLKIVSGDAAATVRSVAEAARWRESTERVVTGPELDQMEEAELAVVAQECSLFARVSPQNKKALVSRLRADGHYVAMVGDGVNDVLAMKSAELGVAMQSGNRMARDVCDIVLLENDFTVLPEVLREGATIVANVQSAAKLFLTKNVFAVLLIVATGFIGLTFPFVPRHVTIFNFFAITVPSLLIAFSRRIPEVPRSFLRDVLRFTGISGACIGGGALVAYFADSVLLGAPVERARTVLLTQIVLLSLLNFLVILGGVRFRENLRRNRGMIVFALGFAILYLAALLVTTRVDFLAPFAEFLEVQPLTGTEIGLALGITAAAGTLLVLLQRRVARRG